MPSPNVRVKPARRAKITAASGRLPAGKVGLSHVDLNHDPYVLYGVKYIDLVSPMTWPHAADR